jgi:hypothetical protein
MNTLNVIKVDCPSCGQSIEMPKADAQRGLNCPSCSQFFRLDLGDESQAQNIVSRKKMVIAGIGMAIIITGWIFYSRWERVNQFKSLDYSSANWAETNSDRCQAVFWKISERLISPNTAKIVDAHYWNNESGPDHCRLRIMVESQNIYGAMLQSEWGVDEHLFKWETNSDWLAGDPVFLDGSKTVLK